MITTAQTQAAVNLVMASNGTISVGEALNQVLADANHTAVDVSGPHTMILAGPSTGKPARSALVITTVRRPESREIHNLINGKAGCDRFRPSQARPVIGDVTCATCIIAAAEARGDL